MARRTVCCAQLGVIFLILCGPAGAAAVQQVGRAEYATQPPPSAPQPPTTIYRTPQLTGAMPTNDWWSSLAWQQYSSNQFPHPLAVCAKPEGLVVWYPGTALVAGERAVVGPNRVDLTLGLENVAAFDDARVHAFSDWFVTAAFSREGAPRLCVSYGHGCPFVYATSEAGPIAVRLQRPAVVWHGAPGSDRLGITVNGAHYGLFGPTGARWEQPQPSLFICRTDRPWLSVALLPENSPEVMRLFGAAAHNHVEDTRVSWRYEAETQEVVTEFRFALRLLAGGDGQTLFALYPHQWSNTDHELLPYQYKTIRGAMKLAAGTGFTVRQRFPGLLPEIPIPPLADRPRLRQLLREGAAVGLGPAQDTYWDGKQMGDLANLIPIAAQLGETDSGSSLQNRLRQRLEDWFTVGGNPETDRHFYLNRTWGALIGHKPSYGSDTELNDHHFHYGYFIRAAAEIARRDPAWAGEAGWGGLVNLLIRDIASADRTDPLFPFLRCFDPYAGHSWASGHAKFADGNNQESSSEALQAWAAVALWGEATGNAVIRDLGIYLFTSEVHAASEYWFDVHHRVFPEGYGHRVASLIWGGKFDYATWFSGRPEHIHGIVLLPIHSGSTYLGVDPAYVRDNLDDLARSAGVQPGEWRDWHDVFCMYEALADPDAALRHFNRDIDRMPPIRRAHALAWIEMLRAWGQLDTTVTADYPLAMTFTRGGRRTHIAFNLGSAERTIRFSTGTQLRVSPGGSTTVTE